VKRAPSLQDLDAELTAALRARGQRVTHPRILVHRHVRRADQHVTAEQLHQALSDDLPSLSAATIYATLDVLEELGFVRRMSTPGGTTVFDSRVEDHHHAICRSCGRIEDVDGRARTAAVAEAAQGLGFVVEHAEVQLSGRCAACAAA
jgi:Fe2+ or Zn2+ uptake regulation protein